MLSVMFQNVCSTSALGSFQTYGSIAEVVREDLEKTMFTTIRSHWNELREVLQQRHPGSTPGNLRPFVGKEEPNIISFFHLIAQSINDEWVCLTFLPFVLIFWPVLTFSRSLTMAS